MRKVGNREVRQPGVPSSGALVAIAPHLRLARRLARVSSTGIAKGVYRFSSHESANAHADEALARVVAANTRALRKQ